MMEEAKTQCSHLICGLHTDPTVDRPEKNKPIQTVLERYLQLRACRYVDEIIPYETENDLRAILATQKIDVRIMGEEYKDTEYTGKDICQERGIEIYFNSRRHDYSTTELRNRIKNG